jgi:hypothetical protein
MSDEGVFSQLGFDRWTVVFALCFVLLLLALRSIWRSKAHSRKAKTLWSLISLIPLLGPAAWFAAGSQRRRH